MSTQKSFKTSLYDYFKSYNTETSVTLVNFMETYHNRLQTPTTMEILYEHEKKLNDTVIEILTESPSEALCADRDPVLEYNVYLCLLSTRNKAMWYISGELTEMCIKYCIENPKFLFTRARFGSTEPTATLDVYTDEGFHMYMYCFTEEINKDCISNFFMDAHPDMWIEFIETLIKEYTLKHTMNFLNSMLYSFAGSPDYDFETYFGTLILENMTTNLINTVEFDTYDQLLDAFKLIEKILQEHPDVMLNYFINNRKKILRVKEKYNSFTIIQVMEKRYKTALNALCGISYIRNTKVFPTDLANFIVNYVSEY